MLGSNQDVQLHRAGGGDDLIGAKSAEKVQKSVKKMFRTKKSNINPTIQCNEHDLNLSQNISQQKAVETKTSAPSGLLRLQA